MNIKLCEILPTNIEISYEQNCYKDCYYGKDYYYIQRLF